MLTDRDPARPPTAHFLEYFGAMLHIPIDKFLHCAMASITARDDMETGSAQ
jgi:hypothetical protein